MKILCLLLTLTVCFCSEEALHNLNTALTLARFQSVTLASDVPATFSIQTSCRMKVSPGKQINASALVRIFCGGIWHSEPFPMPESGDEEILTEYSITLTPGTPFKGSWIKNLTKIDGINCFYRISYVGQALTIHITRTPTPFLVMNPYNLSELTSIEAKLPPYTEYFRTDIFPRIQNAYDPQRSYDALLGRLDTIPFDAPYKIPTRIHTIWFTNPSNPRLPQEECFAFLRQTMQTCPAKFGWNYTLWVHSLTDNPELAASPTHDAALDPLVKIKEISVLFQNSEDAYVQGVRHIYEAALRAKNYGMASDIARLVVLYLEGGIYRDTDFAFLQSPKRLHQVCSFYGGLEDSKCLAANNAMIASAPKHPVLMHYLELICSPPTLPADFANPVIQTLFHTGPFAMTMAFYASCHSRAPSCHPSEGGNPGEADSCLLPPHIFYLPPHDGDGIRKAWPLTTLGRHDHHQDWVR